MLNKDKYKTLKEKSEAFSTFCRNYKFCSSCPISDKTGSCPFIWLESEESIPKTSKDMISDLIENVSGIEIMDEESNEARIEMLTKLLSHRNEIQQIWQKQDKEEMNNEEL